MEKKTESKLTNQMQAITETSPGQQIWFFVLLQRNKEPEIDCIVNPPSNTHTHTHTHTHTPHIHTHTHTHAHTSINWQCVNVVRGIYDFDTKSPPLTEKTTDDCSYNNCQQ